MNPGLGELAALGAALGWGLINIVVRAESQKLDVLFFNALRNTFSAGYMLLALLVLGLLQLHRPAFGPDPLLGLALLALSVILLVGVGDSMYFLGVQRIGVARALPLSMLSLLLTTALAVAFFAEPFTIGLAAGLVLIPPGLMLVTLPSGRPVEQPILPHDLRAGLLLVLVSSVIWAGASVIVRPGLDQVDVVTAAGFRSSVAAVSVWIVAWGTGRLRTWPAMTRARLGMALLGGLLTTLSSFLFIVGIQQAGVARTTMLTATAPLYAVPLAVWLLREHVTPRMMLGTLITVVGVVLVVSI